jgi:hypothetical protein
MSDVVIGIETELDDKGTKALAKEVSAAQVMAAALEKTNAEQGKSTVAQAIATAEFAKQSEDAAQKLMEEEEAARALSDEVFNSRRQVEAEQQALDRRTAAANSSADATRNLQGAGQQLTAALNGNITAIAKSIELSPQFVAALQGAFSVIGAATFGYGVGSALYKSVIEPSLKAKLALTDLAGVTADYAASVDREEFSNYLETTKKITASYTEQAAALGENEERMERAFEWAKKLLDVQYEIEELRVKAMPEGPDREKAMSALKEQKGKDDVSLQIEQAQQKLQEAGRQAIAANSALSRAKGERDRLLAEAKNELIGLDSLTKFQAPKAIEELGSGSVMDQLKKKFGIDADYRPINSVISQYRRGSQLQEQIGLLEKGDDLKELEAAKLKAEKAFFKAREEARFTSELAGLKNTALGMEKGNSLSEIAQQEESEARKAEAATARDALESEKDRLEKERRATKDRVELANKRGLPEQVAAQREAAEAQGAANVLSRSPSGVNRRTYERELAEAKAAEEKAVQAVDALAARFRSVSDQLDKIEQRLQQNDSGGRDGGAASSIGPIEQAAVGAGGDTQRGDLEEKRRSAERDALREADQAQRAAQRFERTPSATNRRNYERELAEAKAAEQQANQAVAALSKHLQAVNDQLKKVEQQIRNMPVQ